MLFCLFLQTLQAQVTYEDFEGGIAGLPWVGINGSYDGAVANPDPTGLNTSGFVGSYTTNDASDFNFAIADLAAPADMGTYGLVKVKIWSPVAPSKCLLKFEGSGAPVEMFRDITVANQWVEYSFDLTAGASNPTGLTKVLISFHSFLPGVAETFYFDDIVGFEPKACYETFEGGSPLTWTAFDGAYEGPVANPAPNSVNSSDNCARYTKSGMHAYSLLLAESTQPFDLSVLNQFSLDIYATAPTQVLLKLEGTGGAVEKIRNIGLTNTWQTYTFDFSEQAANTGLTKVVLFFDPGVETSADDYFIDNLCATPKGVCANATPDPDMVDDFDCNRNATYVNGWDSLQVVPNPAPNPINSSAHVGRYGDPVGEPWAALLIDYQNPIDLSVKNQLHTKIWSPKATQVLFKLEGGASAPKEVWVDITTPDQWLDYVVDFGSEALNSHRKIVFFFNAGQDAEPGDTYFIDEIRWAEPTETVLEDFENGGFLPWEPLDQQTVLHGTFAIVANPAPAGVNTSANVGKYTKGTAAFSTLSAVAPGVIDISQKPQYNLDVWAPVGATTVTMQLESATQGNKEVTRELQAPGNWETVNFDFSDYQGITDWVSMNLLFNPGVAEAGAMYFFDNLIQSLSTVDPCEGVLAVTNIIDDFECQRNYEPANGSDLLSVVTNPVASVTNSSIQVGQYDDQPNQPWDALCYNFPGTIDLEVFNQLSIMVLADQAAPVLLKLEGGSSPAAEIWTDYTTPGEWQKLSADFAGQAGQDHQRVCFFFNGGNDHAGAVETYYIDNLALEHAPFDGCIMNFDQAAFSSLVWNYFPNDGDGAFEVIDNPDPSGINTSAKVGKAVEKASSGQPWQGMYTDLPSYIDLSATKLVKMKIWSPQVASVTMKLENPANPGAPGSSGDNTVANTKANEWEELTFDFSASPNPLPDDGQYRRVTLIWDIVNIPGADVTYFFDDIQLEGGSCSFTNTFEKPAAPAQLSVFPNPSSDLLNIRQLGTANRLEIRDLMGRTVATLMVGQHTEASLHIGSFPSGMYVVAGYDRAGRLVANARFVKH
ncbi:MAG: hypothetical protein RLY31_2136 [Bacteroidota bacterium]